MKNGYQIVNEILKQAIIAFTPQFTDNKKKIMKSIKAKRQTAQNN